MVGHYMAIGEYRDEPAEMDDVEREVAAAQYPEGGLVVGLGLGIVLPLATVPALLAVAPVLGAVVGFALGRRLRDAAVRRRRADRATAE
ncbi:hypothetical protein Natpe_3543 [Natrinema pellirubrum DSM 15624]|uniref:Uncharacterized protein n=2 Tax=Natrinema pellirubrum (strain DSM 15624 / CIP 106293 / JCM 10476 / NCIMB 786 / 157) TaxID=797303 RepID=L0JRT4_NATP1|nr:hypothetical protein Natpe_3543 [Natrinema pellirubrum DSM 15624]